MHINLSITPCLYTCIEPSVLKSARLHDRENYDPQSVCCGGNPGPGNQWNCEQNLEVVGTQCGGGGGGGGGCGNSGRGSGNSGRGSGSSADSRLRLSAHVV